MPAPVRTRLQARLGRRPWPVRVDAYLEPGVTEPDVDQWVQSASILHANGDALAWIRTRMKVAAPQALVVAS